MSVLEGHSSIASLFNCNILYLWHVLQTAVPLHPQKLLVSFVAPVITLEQLKLQLSNFEHVLS